MDNNRNYRSVNGFTIIIFMVIVFGALWMANRMQMHRQEMTYTEFVKQVEAENVTEVYIDQNKAVPTGTVVFALKDTDENRSVNVSNVEKVEKLLDKNEVLYQVSAIPETSMLSSVLLPTVITLGGIMLLFFLMNRQGNGANAKAMNFGKSRARMTNHDEIKVTFANVAGLQEEKEELAEIVDFLKAPKKYVQVGARIPKGVLLEGPPGTGKTLLAKAVAGEAGVPFFSISGSDFVEMFVGVGASRVRDLFQDAKKNAPCIIFIDEIDAIGKSRDSHYGGGNDEREQTLNQLLAEMDGFDTSKGLLILAATNRPEVLDKALLRPGRFDRRIIVDKPDLKGRVETLRVHSKDVKMDDSVDLDAIALATAGCVGSDLANMINEAAINAVKNGRQYVTQADLFESVEVVIAGKEKKDRIMGPKEKRLVAYHEVGHALVTALQKDAEPVQKITIVPRTMGSLGYTLQMPEEEKYLETKAELEARLVTYMGGRAAEEIMCDSVTTGASNDIEMATRIARAMVTQFGMSEEFGLMGVESVENRYLDGRAVTNCGDDTIAKVDEVVKVMLQKAYDTAKEMLLTHRDVLERIAGYLYEHETITGKEFMDIFNEMAEAKQPIDVDAEDVTVQTEEQTAELSENETELSGNEPVAPEEAFEE